MPEPHDNADRLTSTISSATGASPVIDVDLTTAGTAASATLAYDSHGNTTKLADQTLRYDVADRHMGTTLKDGTVITYVRDVTGRIVARTSDPPGATPATTIRYTFSAGGLFAVLNASNQLIQREVSLPGGVSLWIPAAGGQTWAYPNLHGDVILTTDATGLRTGIRASYDPFGQPIDPVTGDIGTEAADDAIPDTRPGDADYGYVGQHDKLYEHQGSIATIEMGVRQYVPALGRFLSVDPVEGSWRLDATSYGVDASELNHPGLKQGTNHESATGPGAKSSHSSDNGWAPGGLSRTRKHSVIDRGICYGRGFRSEVSSYHQRLPNLHRCKLQLLRWWRDHNRKRLHDHHAGRRRYG